MNNFYELLKKGTTFKKFELNELLFVEYNCPLENESEAIWAHSDYIVHVLSGKKTWKTMSGSWEANSGETLYVRKGAAIIDQFFEDEFCMLGFFIPDDLIRETVNEIRGKTSIANLPEANEFSISKINTGPIFTDYFSSMLSYLHHEVEPIEDLLKLKGRELIINIINSDENPLIESYFNSISQNTSPSLPHIMEANYCYNLSLDEFAKLCHRSISSFKRDFQSHYSTSPGKWLITKRLERSATLLKGGIENISQLAYECGFENASHFSRSFKEKFGVNPSQFRAGSDSN